MSASQRKPTQVSCPTCGKRAAFDAANAWRPFCSERCRIRDLGAWASESYRIPAKPDDDDATPSADDSTP